MTQLIQLERAANVRELGGYQTTNGTTIKRKIDPQCGDQ